MQCLAGVSLPQASPLSDESDLHHLAQRVVHNLRHQHQWTTVATHVYASASRDGLLPRPVISGLPPQRIYVHPDEQMEFLEELSKPKAEDNSAKIRELRPEKEWVLPTHLREKWTLSRFAEVFDAIPTDPNDQVQGEPGASDPVDAVVLNKWRATKRLLLATVDDDGTIVYYIVHDGIVKPRQN